MTIRMMSAQDFLRPVMRPFRLLSYFAVTDEMIRSSVRNGTIK